MSRRHTFIEAQIDPTLVFYAPLTQGDFLDHISGEELIIREGITVEWDNVKNAYHFLQSSADYGVAGYWENLNLDIDIVNWGFTMVADYGAMYNGTDESRYRCIDIGGLVNHNSAPRCIVQSNIHRANYGITTNEIHRLAVKWATDGQTYLFANGFRNNEWKKPEEVYAAWTGLDSLCNVLRRETSTPADWVKTTISIGRMQGYPQMTDIWVKNIRIYKRELTIPEIIAI